MPIRGVTEHIRTKWRRSSTKLDSPVVATPSPGSPSGRSEEPPKAPPNYAPNPDGQLHGIGVYTFLHVLGDGKFSRVMLAQHYLTMEKFAVKVIDKRVHDYRVMSRLVREIALMEVLDHQNIVHLYETYETADSLFLVMEYVPGVNLDEHLQHSGGQLQETEARAIFRQIVAAVDYCHSRWVVHRDLKAPNILLMPNGEVRLADFGLGNRFGMHRLKTICGSMLYYSPEIISGQKYIGPEVDCWCLGISLFRMTAGFEPFAHARTVGELKKDVLSRNYPMPPHLSEPLKRTIQKCLAVDRRQRMGVRHTLKDDPWLNDDGKLEDLFKDKTTISYVDDASSVNNDMDNSNRSRLEKERARSQFIRDMQEEQRRGYRVKKTVIYHPYNASIYFTNGIAHSRDTEENFETYELIRRDLFHEFKLLLQQVHLQPMRNMPLSDLKSPIQHILRKFKRTSHEKQLRRSSSALNLSQLYQRVTKDQVFYYTIQSNVCAVSSTTVVSGCSSHSMSTFSVDNRMPSVTTTKPRLPHLATQQQRDEYELLLIVCSACEFLGVSYKHESKSRLACLLTLRDYTVQRKRASQVYSLISRSTSSNVTNISVPSLAPTHRQLSSDAVSYASYSDKISEGSQTHWWARQMKRLSLPIQSSPWSNTIHLSSTALRSNLPMGGHERLSSQQHQPSRSSTAGNKATTPSDEGTTLFMIEVFSVPATKTSTRIVGLRFSKMKGSSKAFKLATGWISCALASNNESSE
ncbi:kinase-like domain-containing protein [Radiomyces spectabilis]|uniref:kinase-like domain-containing protein n=1 Tax=Radiomyces spectabilis TaxID=64574 RepID=UPI00221FED41|nr:kinase-like domain-containing protein [Radiomyces spectabilis]KAI8384320.1 kinase-like domain-containing protein [Radiomyces spectabilis]